MTTRYVQPLESIQDKIDESSNGDVIIVHEGIYGAIDFGGKAITIQNNEDDFVKIDGGLFHRCVTFDTSETSTSILSGITVANGYAKSDNEQYGGGVYIGTGCSPKLKNCIIEDCKADYSGGGVFCKADSAAVFENCIIQDCQCSIDSTSYYGGGVGIETMGVSGGNTFTNCLIINNYSYGDGGGVYCSATSGGDHTLLNCTIYGNEAVGDGGGVYIGNSSLEIKNCIIYGNTGNSISDDINGSTSATPTISYSCIYGRIINYTYTSCITNDPLFTDADDDDFTLKWNSPCIDTGTNTGVTISTDLAGNTRTEDGNGDGTQTVDMGCYEDVTPTLADTTRNRHLLQALLPPGLAWNQEEGSNLTNLLQGFAREFARIASRAKDLIIERSPQKTTELIKEHEHDFDIPDTCIELAGSYRERRNVLHTKQIATGRQDKAYFIELADSLKLTIVIIQYGVFLIGTNGIGDRIGSEGRLPLFTVGVEFNHGSPCELIQTYYCLMQKYKPAQSVDLWSYFGPGYTNGFSSGYNSMPESNKKGGFSSGFSMAFDTYNYSYQMEKFEGGFTRGFTRGFSANKWVDSDTFQWGGFSRGFTKGFDVFYSITNQYN